MGVPYVGPVEGNLRQCRPNTDKRHFELPNNCLPILAIDPGGTLGWSLLVIPRKVGNQEALACPPGSILKNKVLWHHGEIFTKLSEDLAMYQITKLMSEWPSAAVVCEGFVLRKPQKGEDVLSPVRQIAIIRNNLWLAGRRVFMQDPSMKYTANDERLHNWGVYTRKGGLEHARDADRHAMVFLHRNIQHPELRMEAWPHIYRDMEEQEAVG